MLALLCLTGTSAWAQDTFDLREGDTWDGATKTLTVNTDFEEDEEDGTYQESEEIEHVIIANTVTRIGDYTFEECENLASVSIPSSVTYIGEGAFYGTALTSVTIPGNEENGTEIEWTAFADCDNLTTVTIGNGVRNIRPAAFGGDALEKFIVYSESTDGWVFGGTQGEEGVFEGQGDFTIYVFSNLVDDFKTNMHYGDDRYGWKVYADRIEAIPDLTAISDGAGNYWATYYNNLADVQMPEGTQVFKVALDGTGITLTEITDRIVKAGEGVVLKSSSASITLASALESTGNFTGNCLTGKMTEIENPGNAYVLNTGAQGTGFYKLGSGETIGANVAYLTYDGSEDFLAFPSSEPAEPATYDVTMKEGTDDADNWVINPANAASGTEITLKYNGRKKVKSITIEKAAAPALLELTVTDPYGSGVGAKTFYYADGETWGEAITNHATENAGWNIVTVEDYPDIFHFVRYNENRVYCGSAGVQGNDLINASASYEF